MIARYNNALNSRPVVTKSWTAGILGGLGDFFAQCIERKRNSNQKFSVSRTIKMAGFSATFGAVSIHAWYTHALPKVNGKVRQTLEPVVKMVLDQALFSPFLLTTFFLGMNFLDNKKLQEGREKISKKFWPTMLRSWTVWPAVQIVNFALVPVHQQVVVASFVGLGWRTYLSYVNYDTSDKLYKQQN